jgi:beta-galactosidase
MVHLLPMDWTGHKPGDVVEVWAYANVDTVELYLNGRSLGVRRFDTKKTLDGWTYLETTEATGDDKTVTGGPYRGSYTSPNGSAGKLHLTWQVPFAVGELRAVARKNGQTVATDVLRTAGEPHAIRLTPDRNSVVADGTSLVYVTAEVIDSHGVVVPGADHLITFKASGGSLAGLDNGRQESAERYQATTRTAFHGKALAILRSGTSAGHLSVTATARGLHSATASVRATHASGPVATTPPLRFAPDPGQGAPVYPLADASYSGSTSSLPAAMVDGNPATGWSNAFKKSATALLPAFSGARPEDWVSITWADAQYIDTVSVNFTIDATHSLPATVAVSYWDGDRWTPVTHPAVTWATATDAPTVITFSLLHTASLRLDLTSAAPDTAAGAQRISELTVSAG